jgi:uncharacterized protein YjcR
VDCPSPSRRDLIDVYAFAEHQGVEPATVRSWVLRYGVARRGKDGRRALFSLADLYAAERQARANSPLRHP